MLWSLLLIPLIPSASAHLNDHNTANCKEENWTQSGFTSQSSIYTNENANYTSARAIDGNMEQCSHTLQLPESWWQIDLQGVYKISSISIYNKQHQHTDITGAKIYIGNSRENNGTANSLCQNITNFNIGQHNNFSFNTSGRFITVFLPEKKYLILCEVKICGLIKDPPFSLISEKKTWEDALYHCRGLNMDLASILDKEAQAWAELIAKKAETPFVWLGLRYTCTLEFWFWVEDRGLDYNRWAPNEKTEGCNISVAMETKDNYLWFSKSDNEKFNFICAKQEK